MHWPEEGAQNCSTKAISKATKARLRGVFLLRQCRLRSSLQRGVLD